MQSSAKPSMLPVRKLFQGKRKGKGKKRQGMKLWCRCLEEAFDFSDCELCVIDGKSRGNGNRKWTAGIQRFRR